MASGIDRRQWGGERGEYNIGWSLKNRIASNEIEKTQQEIIVIILILDERSIDSIGIDYRDRCSWLLRRRSMTRDLSTR